jgi:hypothetical protein
MAHTFGRATTVAVVLLLPLFVAPQAVQAASINVSPTTVAPGGTIRLSGDLLAPDGTPGCPLPTTVLLISDAFVGIGENEGPGLGSVRLPVDATAHFAGTVTLSDAVVEGTYQIGGRACGGTVDALATLEITNLPATGPQIAAGPMIAAAAGLVVGGVALLLLCRRPAAPHERTSRRVAPAPIRIDRRPPT